MEQQQTYHPDNVSTSEKEPTLEASFNRALVSRWCCKQSEYHPIASRYLNTSWRAFLVQLQDIKEQAPHTLEMQWDQQFPELTDMHYEKPADDKHELSMLKSLLNIMLSEIGPALIQYPQLKKHPSTVVGHQVIHDLFRLLPEQRFGN